MKTNFPFTAIHQLLLVFFSGSGVSIFRTYFFIFHMQGVQKIRILQFFFSFLTKLVWMPQNGYIESAEEEANKEQFSIAEHIVSPLEDEPDKTTDTTAAKARTVATTTVRRTARKEEGVISVVQNPRELALSARLPGHSQLILVNVYIIKMMGNDAGIYPPPLVKVGYSNDPLRRRRDLDLLLGILSDLNLQTSGRFATRRQQKILPKRH